MLAAETYAIAPRATMVGHSHRRSLLLIVSAGDLEEACDESVQPLCAGSVRISRPGAAHDLAFGADGARCTLIGADGPFWSRIYARALRGRAQAFAAITADAAPYLAGANSEALLRSRAATLAFGRVLSVLEHGEPQRAPAWLDESLDALDRGGDRRVGQIARTLRRDRVHFARAFAAHVGLRPREYRAVRRLAAALAALGSEQRLSEIALEVGYAHQSHMNNAFRALLGRSPARVRAA